jgi:hypothetical protein
MHLECILEHPQSSCAADLEPSLYPALSSTLQQSNQTTALSSFRKSEDSLPFSLMLPIGPILKPREVIRTMLTNNPVF